MQVFTWCNDAYVTYLTLRIFLYFYFSLIVFKKTYIRRNIIIFRKIKTGNIIRSIRFKLLTEMRGRKPWHILNEWKRKNMNEGSSRSRKLEKDMIESIHRWARRRMFFKEDKIIWFVGLFLCSTPTTLIVCVWRKM